MQFHGPAYGCVQRKLILSKLHWALVQFGVTSFATAIAIALARNELMIETACKSCYMVMHGLCVRAQP